MTTRRVNIKYSEAGFMGFGKWQATLPEQPHHLYCTNGNGEGLFTQRYDNGEVRQIMGLGQFHARNFDHFKNKMRKMRGDDE